MIHPIEKGLSEVRHFSSDNEQELISALIVEPLPTKRKAILRHSSTGMKYRK